MISHAAREKFYDIIAQLPPNFVIRELADVFFSEANWYFGILEPYYFERLYSSWGTLEQITTGQAILDEISPELLYFPTLLFQVLAVALQFLPPSASSISILQVGTALACDRLSERYSEKGVELMATLGRYRSTITGVQHDLMRTFWLKNCGRGKEAWYILGSAIR